MITIKNRVVMKRIHKFMASAIVLLTAIACNSEMIDANHFGKVVSFTATVDKSDIDTKAILGTSANSKPQSMWEANDAITIHNGEDAFVFTTTESGKPTAKFTYSGDVEFPVVPEVLAMYPSGDYTIEMSSRSVTANIPTWQESRKSSYNTNAALAVAYSRTGELAFKNACALLKFKVGTNNIHSITISGNNGEKISGEVLVVLAEDGSISSVEPTSKSETYVEVYTMTNSLMQANDVYYVAIIPQEFKYGLKVEAQVTDENQAKYRVKETIAAHTVSRNQIVDLGTISHTTSATIGTGWMMPGGYNSWATGTNNGATRYFYDIGDFYVVKNVKFMDTVPGQAAGFKVLKDGTWKGVTTSGNIQLNTWTSLEGSNNVKVSAKDTYDVYITPDCKYVYVTKTGTAVPYKMLYLNAGEWNDDTTAWFQAWTWSTSSDGKWETFYHISDDEYATIIRQSVTKVKLLRKGPSHASGQWESWNESGDITLNGKNYLKFTGWSNFSLSTK